MYQSKSALIENVERFTWIDLDLSEFENERNHCHSCTVFHCMNYEHAQCTVHLGLGF